MVRRPHLKRGVMSGAMLYSTIFSLLLPNTWLLIHCWHTQAVHIACDLVHVITMRSSVFLDDSSACSILQCSMTFCVMCLDPRSISDIGAWYMVPGSCGSDCAWLRCNQDTWLKSDQRQPLIGSTHRIPWNTLEHSYSAYGLMCQATSLFSLSFDRM